MTSALITAVSIGCFLMASLVLADDYLRRDVPKFAFNKGARPAQRKVPYYHQGNKAGNVGAYRVTYPYSGNQGRPNMADPYNNQPGYVGSTGNNQYNNRQGNDPHGIQGNKGGNADLYKGVDPYVANQGWPAVVDPYNNQPGYNGGNTGNDRYIKNQQGNDQYHNQGNRGGNVGTYSAADAYDGNQGSPKLIDRYNSQPGYIGGSIGNNPYNNNNRFDDKTVYNNP